MKKNYSQSQESKLYNTQHPDTNMFIKELKPRIILNSRREKTIEIFLETFDGKFSASAPSGKSKGKHEIPSYNLRGPIYSLRLLKLLAKKWKHKNFLVKKFDDLKIVEGEIRKFEQGYGRLGGNFVYALEAVILKACAKEKHKEVWEFILAGKKRKMPMPVGNCIGGGKHSHNSDKPDFQEFLFIPNEKTFSRAVTKMIYAYEKAGRILKKKEKKWKIGRNDEGAWKTGLSNEIVLDVMKEVAENFGMRVGVDVASSSFYKRGYYHYNNKKLIRDRQEQIDFIERLIGKYKLFYVEDCLQEEDFSGFKEINDDVSNRAMIVGDDLTTTNLARVRRAVKAKAINAVIIKPNQIGSLVEAGKVVEFCKENKIKTILSHRSGETMDNILGDLAVGWGVDFVKFGIFGKERLVKLGRVMKIEKNLLFQSKK